MERVIKQLAKKGHKFVIIMNPYEYKYIVSGVMFKTLKEVKIYFGL
jgi:predicted CoA-binding protein